MVQFSLYFFLLNLVGTVLFNPMYLVNKNIGKMYAHLFVQVCVLNVFCK